MMDTEFHSKTKRTIEKFPKTVKEFFAIELFYLSIGIDRKHKPLSSLGKGIFEIKKNGRPAYRVVYKIENNIIHVIEAFSKTSTGTSKAYKKNIKERGKGIKKRTNK